jgi:competence ComEA-like helix-hairpin-helix protein
VTVLKALAINVLMLVLTVGVLYWAAERGNDTESAQAVALLSQADSATIPVSVQPGAVPRRPVPFPFDLNSARVEDFMELPGIGEKLAQRLVEYRRSHSGFRSVEDLRKVRGIGVKRMKRLRPLVRTAEAP